MGLWRLCSKRKQLSNQECAGVRYHPGGPDGPIAAGLPTVAGPFSAVTGPWFAGPSAPRLTGLERVQLLHHVNHLVRVLADALDGVARLA